MPHVTTILGNEAGIQYQGVKDASSVLGVPLINGLIVGQFKRGRLDRPMTITLENIRGTLGHDPANPDYIAVMDALSAGVPSVQVMRVESGSNEDNGWAQLNCPNGYLCYVSFGPLNMGLTGVQEIYIPIALSKNGPSITRPFTIDFSQSGVVGLITDQLNAQLNSYGLKAAWGINHSSEIQIGTPYNSGGKMINEITKFYILDEGNTFDSRVLARGLPPLTCFFPM